MERLSEAYDPKSGLPLLQKLQADGFTGPLQIHFTRGPPDSVQMTKHVTRDEYDGLDSTAEPEKDFTLKP